MTETEIFKILAYAFTITAIGMHLLHTFFRRRIKNTILNGTITTGKIIEMTSRAKGNYCIRYQYNWIDTLYEGKNYVTEEYYSRVNESDDIPINVAEENPKKPRISGTKVHEVVPLVFKILKVIFAILAVAYIILTIILENVE